MQFSTKLVALVATTFFAALGQAVQLTNSAYGSYTSGQTVTLTWTGDGSPVNILLESGSTNNLQAVSTLVSSATGGSSTVTIPSIGSGTYTFKIEQSGQANYSPQFSVSGNGQYTTTNTPYYTTSTGYTNGVPTTSTGYYTPTTSCYTTSTGYYTTSTGYYNGVPTTSTGYVNPVTQINDGQVQVATGVNGVPIYSVPYNTSTTTGVYAATPIANGTISFEGAANKVVVGAGAAIAGGLAVLLSL